MREFHIVIQSFRDIQTFISTAMVQPFQIQVGNETQLVNAKSFIGMVTLDYSRPLKVLCDGDSDSVKQFYQQVRQFLA